MWNIKYLKIKYLNTLRTSSVWNMLKLCNVTWIKINWALSLHLRIITIPLHAKMTAEQ